MTIEYICACCGDKCTTERPDEDARRERERNFGAPVKPDDAMVCDDCYNAIMRAARG
jgi:hypothetical protein